MDKSVSNIQNFCSLSQFNVELRDGKTLENITHGKTYKVLAMKLDKKELPQVLIARDDRQFKFYDLSNFLQA